MKKMIVFVVVMVFFSFFASLSIYAEMAQDITEELEINTEISTDELPQEAEDKLSELGISADNTDAITDITVADVMEYIVDSFKDKLKYPLTIFISLLCVIIAGAMIENTGDCVCSKSIENVYGIIGILISAGIITEPVLSCINSTAEALYSGGNFMVGYVPVFAGITASSGGFTSAAAYNFTVLLAAEAAVQISSNYILPAMSVCMSLGIIESVNPTFSLTALTQAITKGVKFVLGLIMTVFIGLLSLQSIIGASADTIGVKAAKYLASNFIPVVGSAVAEAYTTLKSSLGILRGGVGFFGVAAIFLTVVPPLIEIIAMRAALAAAEIIGDIFGNKKLGILLKNSSNVLSILFSLLICFAVMLIISTALLMMIGLNIS